MLGVIYLAFYSCVLFCISAIGYRQTKIQLTIIDIRHNQKDALSRKPGSLDSWRDRSYWCSAGEGGNALPSVLPPRHAMTAAVGSVSNKLEAPVG